MDLQKIKVENSVADSQQYFIKIARQALELLTKMSQVFTSTNDTVTVNVQKSDGTTVAINVPSMNSVNNKFNKQQRDIKNLFSLYKREKNLPDEEKIKIREADQITGLTPPKQFNFKPNWFLESFLSPLLQIQIFLKDKVDPNTKAVVLKRVIIRPNNQKKKLYTQNNFVGKNDLQYETLLNDLVREGISYSEDEKEVALPPSKISARGFFTVIGISPGETANANTYFLDTLEYEKLFGDNYQKFNLKIGDSVFKNGTEYQVIDIDVTRESIKVFQKNGDEPIQIGLQELRVGAIAEANPFLEVNVGFDEYSVLFIKPIDPYYNTIGTLWSKGVGVYSNDLLTETTDGILNLSDFYSQFVTDYSISLLNHSVDAKIPTIYAIKPAASKLNKDNFKVVKINTHKLQQSETSELSNRIADKVRLTSKLFAFNNELGVLYEEYERLSYTKFIGVPTTPAEITQKAEETARLEELRKNIDEIIIQRNITTTSLNSVIDQLKSYGKQRNINVDPKYHVRGFWPIPDAKFDARTGFQEVIQFQINYRYLSTKNKAKDAAITEVNTALDDVSTSSQISFIGNTGEKRVGYYSPWNEVYTAVRKKVYDELTGKFKWEIENVENADVTNINQLDIPITKGEIVEIRIKSISEAGWPSSLVTSDWSEAVQVEFPDQILDETDTDLLLKNLESDELNTLLSEQLNANGLKITALYSVIDELKTRIQTLELKIP